MDVQHLYGYVAFFEDGTQIVHDMNGSDTSTRFEGKTLFTDILFKSGELDTSNSIFEDNPSLLEEMEKNKSKLISFVLHDNDKTIGVDLRDGHFEINKQPFFQHRPDLDNYKDFRIIYYRTVRREINQETMEELNAYAAAYVVGWQVTHNGKNEQRIVVV